MSLLAERDKAISFLPVSAKQGPGDQVLPHPTVIQGCRVLVSYAVFCDALLVATHGSFAVVDEDFWLCVSGHRCAVAVPCSTFIRVRADWCGLHLCD